MKDVVILNNDLPYDFPELVKKACLKAFWRKDALIGFLKHCQLRCGNRFNSKTKSEILDIAFRRLRKPSKSNKVQILNVATEILAMTSYPDLIGWSDSEQKLIEANSAVEALRHAYNNLNQRMLFIEDNFSPARYTVFISHLTAYKEEAVQLRVDLSWFGITAFVSHEDIEPTTEWQEEIEDALKGAPVFVALLKPSFHESRWCDQEIGFAYAHRKTIIPVIQGEDPYGFIGKIQGVRVPQEFLWWEVYKQLPGFNGNELCAMKCAITSCKISRACKQLMRVITSYTKIERNEIIKLAHACNPSFYAQLIQ